MVAMVDNNPKTPPRVVIAEDHAAFRLLLKDTFVEAGFSVVECDDGRALWDTLSKEDVADIAAVVSDHRMPGMLGLEVLERLRSNRPAVPFVLITAFGDHDVHKRAKELGADLVVNKPLDEEELVQAVRILTEER